MRNDRLTVRLLQFPHIFLRQTDLVPLRIGCTVQCLDLIVSGPYLTQRPLIAHRVLYMFLTSFKNAKIKEKRNYSGFQLIEISFSKLTVLIESAPSFSWLTYRDIFVQVLNTSPVFDL